MHPRLSVLVAAAAAALLVPAVTPAAGTRLLVLTERNVDGLRLGQTLAQARGTGRIGPTTPGCELASPRPLAARLRPPLKGFATFDGKAPHRLLSLDVTGGAQTTRHVRVGTSAVAARRAYPEAHLRTSKPSDPLQLTALIVKRGGKDRIWLMLNRPGGRVTDLAVPGPQLCE